MFSLSFIFLHIVTKQNQHYNFKKPVYHKKENIIVYICTDNE